MKNVIEYEDEKMGNSEDSLIDKEILGRFAPL
jgi:hypothetical protein